MSVESNLNSYYEDLVASIAERAKGYEDDGYDEETDAIWQAIDDELIYYCDQGYVLAMAICRGYINWYKDVNWDEITEMLFSDVSEELGYLKKKEQEAKGEGEQ